MEWEDGSIGLLVLDKGGGRGLRWVLQLVSKSW